MLICHITPAKKLINIKWMRYFNFKHPHTWEDYPIFEISLVRTDPLRTSTTTKKAYKSPCCARKQYVPAPRQMSAKVGYNNFYSALSFLKADDQAVRSTDFDIIK